jgi:hypothetical protein
MIWHINFRRGGMTTRTAVHVLVGASLAIVAGLGVVTTAGAATAGIPRKPLGDVAPASSGPESFTLVGTTVETGNVIATGDFTAGGTMTAVTGGDTVKLPGGTFKVLLATTSTTTLNPTTCLEKIAGNGTYSVTGGTGTYIGIKGSGKVRGTVTEVFPRKSGKCDQSAAAEGVEMLGSFLGTVSLP